MIFESGFQTTEMTPLYVIWYVLLSKLRQSLTKGGMGLAYDIQVLVSQVGKTGQDPVERIGVITGYKQNLYRQTIGLELVFMMKALAEQNIHRGIDRLIERRSSRTGSPTDKGDDTALSAIGKSMHLQGLDDVALVDVDKLVGEYRGQLGLVM
jgi:hypothetical protein